MTLSFNQATLLSSEVAQTTNSSSASLKWASGYSVQAAITVTTPAAKNFVDADVSVADDTITETAHGYKTGLKGQFTNSGGALPGGISGGTDYFVIVVNANTYKIATSLVNANAGTAVNITSAAGGGTHTFTPIALAGGAVKLQQSLDDSNWADVASSSQNFTATGIVGWNQDGVHYPYVRAVLTLTAGQVSAAITARITIPN